MGIYSYELFTEYDVDEIIQIFPSATEAEKVIPTGQHINQVCKGKRKTAGGYKWAYAIIEEDID